MDIVPAPCLHEQEKGGDARREQCCRYLNPGDLHEFLLHDALRSHVPAYLSACGVDPYVAIMRSGKTLGAPMPSNLLSHAP